MHKTEEIKIGETNLKVKFYKERIAGRRTHAIGAVIYKTFEDKRLDEQFFELNVWKNKTRIHFLDEKIYSMDDLKAIYESSTMIEDSCNERLEEV